jgi:hypothetical protein
MERQRNAAISRIVEGVRFAHTQVPLKPVSKGQKMGRTLPTTTQIILDEQRAFTSFRRALRREDQFVFDELFARARKHIMAINQADHVLPFEAIMLAMLVELMDEVIKLKRHIDG